MREKESGLAAVGEGGRGRGWQVGLSWWDARERDASFGA